ncbi:sulfatase-like hydrolase/transferase [Grimontia sp. NTOU-MAR1]|uniref:sulfatase-like hydrolase/transferase n=1 Tax=Grimontia sp. NTOU-MAR1 TaxID=3111011 RepID=UPI002DBB34B2|nr:sulfatase-like hydrolase/transferase [Grimontia sp. NTOU-MAR1]WRV97521.1 sulfatase-like hydrolase/transferase [Grimontia sp. NTOU-MAR1]
MFVLMSISIVVLSLLYALLKSGQSKSLGLIVLFSFSLYAVDLTSIYMLGHPSNSALIYNALYFDEVNGIDIIVESAIFYLTFLILVSLFIFVLRKVISNFGVNRSASKRYFLILFLATLSLSPFVWETYSFFNVSTNQITLSKELSNKASNAKGHPQGESKNVIFIFAESLEGTYLDDPRYVDYFRELKSWEDNSVSFDNVRQIEGGSWTIAGMVSSLCGIPLTHPSGGNTLGSVEEFYPGANCLGDILSDYGYDLTFLQNSSLDFSGIRAFYSQHGFKNLLGSKYLKDKYPEAASHYWGVYDDTLLNDALTNIREINPDSKFGYFIATIDSHFPDGYVSSTCSTNEYSVDVPPIVKAASCSSSLIANFISEIRSEARFDDTIIVVASDHFGMGTAAKALWETEQRRQLFFINYPQGTEVSNNENSGSQLDIASTVMSTLGFNEKIGLGVDLQKDVPSLAQDKNIEVVLQNNKALFMSLWDFPNISKGESVNFDNGIVEIGSKVFKAPVLLSISENFEIIPYYKDDESSLLRAVTEFRDEDAFVIYDHCDVLNNTFDDEVRTEGFCFAFGKLSNEVNVFKEEDKNSLTFSQVEQSLLGAADAKKLASIKEELGVEGLLSSQQRWMLSNVPAHSLVYLEDEIYLPFHNKEEVKEQIERFYNIEVIKIPTSSQSHYSLSTTVHKNDIDNDLFLTRDVAKKNKFDHDRKWYDPIRSYFKDLREKVDSGYRNSDKVSVVFFELVDPTANIKAPSYLEKIPEMERYIAHAGGGIDGHHYTNSMEALNESYRQGLRYFEIDLLETSDHRLVAAHEWKEWAKKVDYSGDIPPRYDDFMSKKMHGKYTPLSLEDLNTWFESHPDAFLVTDKVNSPKKVLEVFEFKDRLVMELFTVEALEEATELGIFSPMPSWVTYLHLNKDVERLKSLGVKHLALSTTDIKSNINEMLELKENGIKTFLFNINVNNADGEIGIACNHLNFAYGMYVDSVDFVQEACL